MLTPGLFLLLAASPAQPPEPPPAGQRAKLTDGQLFVPAGYKPSSDGGVELLLHLHGGTAAERQLVRAGRQAVVVSVAIPGLSSVYTKHFADPKAFARILAESQAKLKELIVAPNLSIQRVIVSSFSAGFGGVREMLKDSATFARIDALVMADSIYAGYTGDPAKHAVEPRNMAGFLKFAEEATAGRKWFVLSHCDLQPDGYASTKETADYLIAKLGGTRQPATGAWPADGLVPTSWFVTGRFEVHGFAGTTGADHMRHLHSLWALLMRID